jgi:hypothetical protein
MQPVQRKRTTRAVRGWGRNRLRSIPADRSDPPARPDPSGAGTSPPRPASASAPEDPPQRALF